MSLRKDIVEVIRSIDEDYQLNAPSHVLWGDMTMKPIWDMVGDRAWDYEQLDRDAQLRIMAGSLRLICMENVLLSCKAHNNSIEE